MSWSHLDKPALSLVAFVIESYTRQGPDPIWKGKLSLSLSLFHIMFDREALQTKVLIPCWKAGSPSNVTSNKKALQDTVPHPVWEDKLPLQYDLYLNAIQRRVRIRPGKTSSLSTELVMKTLLRWRSSPNLERRALAFMQLGMKQIFNTSSWSHLETGALSFNTTYNKRCAKPCPDPIWIGKLSL